MRSFFLISLLFISFASFSQKLKGKVSDKKVLIGEHVTLTYTVTTDKTDTIRFSHETNEIKARTTSNGTLSSGGASIEILKPFSEEETLKKGKKYWKGEYEVTAWDSGTFIIPGPRIAIGDSNFYFEDVKIYVGFPEKKSGVGMYEIREKYTELPPEENKVLRFFKKYWWVFLIIGGIILLIRFLSKRIKPKEPVQIKKAMSLKERTLAAIDALENEKLWEKNQLKQHYIELSYILRSYLTARYDISILEKTTFEAKALLLQKGLDADTVDTLVFILSQSDMVKFAKSTPETLEILKISTLARQIVAETSPLDFDNYE